MEIIEREIKELKEKARLFLEQKDDMVKLRDMSRREGYPKFEEKFDKRVNELNNLAQKYLKQAKLLENEIKSSDTRDKSVCSFSDSLTLS